MESVRIQKYLSDCGVMSRRKAEAEIAAGKVKVNNELATIGMKINPDGDAVFYNGKAVVPSGEKKIYIKLNKPRGYVATLSDEKGRKCVADLVKDVGERVYPIGRLDLDSEGLLLMTNDGELANKLMHPSGNVAKVYIVKVRTQPTSEQMSKLNGKMTIDGYDLRPVKVRYDNGMDFKVLRFELHEGRNRQIRKMCEAVGLQVAKLRRISIGDITVAGLGSGKWQYLSHEEIQYLKEI